MLTDVVARRRSGAERSRRRPELVDGKVAVTPSSVAVHVGLTKLAQEASAACVATSVTAAVSAASKSWRSASTSVVSSTCITVDEEESLPLTVETDWSRASATSATLVVDSAAAPTVTSSCTVKARGGTAGGGGGGAGGGGE